MPGSLSSRKANEWRFEPLDFLRCEISPLRGSWQSMDGCPFKSYAYLPIMHVTTSHLIRSDVLAGITNVSLSTGKPSRELKKPLAGPSQAEWSGALCAVALSRLGAPLGVVQQFREC